MADDISLVSSCKKNMHLGVYGNCSTNKRCHPKWQLGQVQIRRKGEDMYTYHFQHPNVILLIQAHKDVLYTTKYVSFLLCSQLYHSNLFGSHLASIKLSLADDLDNLCQPKCHSQTHVNNTSRNHTMNNLLTSDLDDLERSREEGGMRGLRFTIHLFLSFFF